MFKNYLTYNFALAFQRSCSTLALPLKEMESLTQSVNSMVHHFARSIHARDPKEELRFLCVALMCLRDCSELLGKTKTWTDEMEGRFAVLHGRMEQLCLKASEAEAGQFRMFG